MPLPSSGDLPVVLDEFCFVILWAGGTAASGESVGCAGSSSNSPRGNTSLGVPLLRASPSSRQNSSSVSSSAWSPLSRSVSPLAVIGRIQNSKSETTDPSEVPSAADDSAADDIDALLPLSPSLPGDTDYRRDRLALDEQQAQVLQAFWRFTPSAQLSRESAVDPSRFRPEFSVVATETGLPLHHRIWVGKSFLKPVPGIIRHIPPRIERRRHLNSIRDSPSDVAAGR